MPSSSLDPGTILRRSRDGSIKRYIPAIDSDAARGAAFSEAHDELQPFDILEMGPGTFQMPEGVVGVPDTTIAGAGTMTRWVPSPGENAVRYRPRTNQFFDRFASDCPGPTFAWFQNEIDGIDNITFHNLDLRCGEDALYIDGPHNGVMRTWRAYNCRFTTTPGSFHNDTTVFYAEYFRMLMYGCEWICHGAGIPFQNASCLEAGSIGKGVNTIVELYGCRLRNEPLLQPTEQSNAMGAYGSGIIRAMGCYIETVPGGFTNVASFDVRHDAQIQVSGTHYDASRVTLSDAGQIVPITTDP